MTRKDYTAIATAISDEVRTTNELVFLDEATRAARRQGVEGVMWRLIDIFAADNPRFDMLRFQDACGVIEPKKPKASLKGRSYTIRDGRTVDVYTGEELEL